MLLALLLLSCGLFDPRDSDEPEIVDPWNSYVVNETQLLENLEYSYNYSGNSLKYKDILTSDFLFVFATQDVNEHGTVASWNLYSEDDMLINLHKTLGAEEKTVEITELLPLEDEDDIIDTTAMTLYRSYIIEVIDNDQISTYTGKLEIELILVDSFWKIKIWKDFRTTSNQTWGKLKNEYSL